MSTFFRPIRTETELATVLVIEETTETIHLEFKSAIDQDLRSTATDVAAFANAWGGTIVVGVRQKKRGGVDVAGKVLGVQFERDRKQVEQAVDTWIRPFPPVYECNLIRHADGNVLGVNVFPDERLIGIRDQSNHSFEFPCRNNEGNGYMSADQIIERANTSQRSGEIMLRRAAGAIGKLDLSDNSVLMVRDCPVKIVSPVFVEQEIPGRTLRIRREATGQLNALEPHQFLLRAGLTVGGSNLDLSLPYGLVRQAWPMNGTVGIMLHVELLYTDRQWHVM